MDKNTLIFIDSYLSNSTRVKTCTDLIKQIREYFPEFKLAILNKYPNSWGIDSLVDYYFYSGESITIGYPPQEVLDNKLYDRPYVYVKTSLGTLENWMPLTGVTDHVGSMFNSFILTSKFAKALGYKKVFKIEYDTVLDKDEALNIKKDVNAFTDYLLYGKRQEGYWAKPYHYLADIHISGYSVDLFDGFDLIQQDKDYWDLCEKINYYGKWIEYIIPSTISYKNNISYLKGVEYNTEIRKLYPKTKFDTLNGPGLWAEKWKNIPKISRVSYDNGLTESKDEIAIFFWNDKSSVLNIKTIISNQEEILYDNSFNLDSNCWVLDKIKIDKDILIKTTNDDESYEYVVKVNEINKLPTRFIYDTNIT